MVSKSKYKILSIDTSCDETSASITENLVVLSNVIWSQASLHAKWGGVVPSLAKREHEERIDWVIKKSLTKSRKKLEDLDAVAVTFGPGLAIALEVGIRKAKEICKNYNLPLIPVNHIEGHLLSPLALSKNKIQLLQDTFPAYGLITSGGHTEIIFAKNPNNYEVLAQTQDDALGESLDKAARILGFGYPGGEILEKVAKKGNPKVYKLPIPLIGREKEMFLSYSGIKTALIRKIEEIKITKNDLSKEDIENLASSYQQNCFQHLIRILEYVFNQNTYKAKKILCGGGVMANKTLRKMVRATSSRYGIKTLFPFSKKLYGDNAAMIGIAAYFRFKNKNYFKINNLDILERIPNARIDKKYFHF